MSFASKDSGNSPDQRFLFSLSSQSQNNHSSITRMPITAWHLLECFKRKNGRRMGSSIGVSADPSDRQQKYKSVSSRYVPSGRSPLAKLLFFVSSSSHLIQPSLNPMGHFPFLYMQYFPLGQSRCPARLFFTQKCWVISLFFLSPFKCIGLDQLFSGLVSSVFCRRYPSDHKILRDFGQPVTAIGRA